MAQEVARSGEASLDEIERLLGWKVKERVEVVLSDETDDANGSAGVVPYPAINLNVTAPEDLSFLSEYHDWSYELIGHELAHIVHLDTLGGLPQLVDWVFGRVYHPNALQSRWFVEGLAVEIESRISFGGRARAKMTDMVMRAEAIADRELRLDEAASDPLRWPQGSARYLHGGRFLTWLADKYGHEALAEVGRIYGSAVIPYAMNRAVRKAVGAGYDALWAEYQATQRERFAAQLAPVLARGLLEGRQLTAHGGYTGGPRYLPDGRILYFTSGVSKISQARIVEPSSGSDSRLLYVTNQPYADSPQTDGRVLLSQFDAYRTFYSFSELFDLDIVSGATRRLTHGMRARDPALAPDGRTVYFVQNLGTRSRLVRATLDAERQLGPVTVVYEPPSWWQIYTPRISPTGDVIALSVQREGRRDLALIELPPSLDGTPSRALTWLTDDPGLDGGPAFSPDGRWLYFHSGRDDIFNLHAFDRQTGGRYQVTNVMTGAFSPDVSPDGRHLTYLHYGVDGFDVWELPLDQSRFWPAPGRASRETANAPSSAPSSAQTPPLEPESAPFPSHPYRPWQALLPHQWLPFIDADANGTVLGVAIGSEDPLSRHVWAAQLGIGVSSHDLSFSLGYENRQLYPTLQLGLTRGLEPSPSAATINGKSEFSVERVHRLSSDVIFPFHWAVASLQISLGYRYELRQRLTEFAFAPDQLAPVLPILGNLGELTAGISYGRVRRSIGAVSGEYGQRLSLSASYRDRWTGALYRQGTVSASAQQFLLMPWAKNHAVAVRLTFGAGYNELTKRPLFTLGGVPLRDFVRDLIFGSPFSEGGLRGFGPASFAGDFFFSGTAEYRAPVWRIERGYSVLPFYLRTLSAAAFVDVGKAAALPELLKRVGVGMGAELRLDFDYGFVYGATIRFGYARGFGPGAIHNVFLVLSKGY